MATTGRRTISMPQPRAVTWHVLHGNAQDEMPPRRNLSAVSTPVWLALSDGRVLRGECLYDRNSQAHDWFLEGDDNGRPHRPLSAEGAGVTVLAWAEVEPAPLFPFSAATRARRSL